MKSDLFGRELEILLRARPRREIVTSREGQRQLQRLHVAAFRRALLRVRATPPQESS